MNKYIIVCEQLCNSNLLYIVLDSRGLIGQKPITIDTKRPKKGKKGQFYSLCQLVNSSLSLFHVEDCSALFKLEFEQTTKVNAQQ